MQNYNNVLISLISCTSRSFFNRTNMINKNVVTNGTRSISSLVKGSYSTLQKAITSSVRANKEVYGYFSILVFNVRHTPYVVFMYWDLKAGCLAYHKLHRGSGYYSAFFHFIIDTIKSIKEKSPSCNKEQNVILIPKSYVSQSNFLNLSQIFKFSFASYVKRGSTAEVTKLQKLISSKIKRDPCGNIDYIDFVNTVHDVVIPYIPSGYDVY